MLYDTVPCLSSNTLQKCPGTLQMFEGDLVPDTHTC